MKNPHIDTEMLLQFHNGAFTSEEELEFLTHISECDFCADLFSNSFCDDTLLTPPAHLKEEILAKSQPFDVNLVRKVNHFTKRTQLFFYSLKVSCAVLGALVLLVSFQFFPLDGNFSQDHFSLVDTLHQATTDFSSQLNQFTTNLFY